MESGFPDSQLARTLKKKVKKILWEKNKMRMIAIITARGGSKRIPRKNIRDFCGKPILAYSIEAALQSGIFDEVMVSTDDEEIAGIARKYGAAVPFMRSEKTSGDFASTADVVLEVVQDYREKGITFDWFCCIYPTAPFITSGKLLHAYEKVVNAQADAIVPVVRFSFPPQRGFIINNERLEYKWPEYTFSRSQDLEPFYHDAGQFYLLRTEAFMDEKTVVPKKTIPFIIDEMEVQDIDNFDDWHIAEIKYKAMSEGSQK